MNRIFQRFVFPGLLAVCMPQVAKGQDTSHEVVIVGAGAAGLYAAYTLDQLGYDVLVLEASDRHGGRIRSDTLGDVGIEHGAEELYGPRNNFIFDDIADRYGDSAQFEIFRETAGQDDLYVMDADDEGGAVTCWSVTGNCNTDPDIREYWRFYRVYEEFNQHPNDETVADYLESDWNVPRGHRAWHLYDSGSPGGSYGTTIEKLGLRSLSRESNAWTLSSALYGLSPLGYLDALDELYFDAVLPKVLFNRAVSTIDTTGERPVAIDNQGHQHSADAIIVTVSLGVLKADVIDFIPDLPADKQAAIQTIGMGKGMKLSLRFSEAVWESKMMYVLLDGPTASCWPPGKYQPETQDAVLTCFIMGVNAEFMSSLPSDEARLEQALVDLDAALGGAATPAFVEGVVQDWSKEPWILGSYSYPAPDTRPPEGPNQRLILAQAVDQKLFFAGEATHATAASTVPGAMQSGHRAALEVEAAIGPPDTGGGISLNAGLSDAWFSPATNGQGFFIIVFPDQRQLFVSWFTYDVERPAEAPPSHLGEPGHRWLTAQGGWTDNTASLTVYRSQGGVFDHPEPPVESPAAAIGSMTITWHDCENATLEYALVEPDRTGSIALQRITSDKVELCQALQ